MDCFPEELPAFLQSVAERAADQCGLYSEGFREVMHAVLQELMKQKVEPSILPQVVTLLQRWKEHIVSGVENRHELVPEILRLIPLFAMVGANEEGERLYGHMLSVSMGPSWYKEDQLGLMTSVLGKTPASDNVAAMLPLVAGYLERASGEMTFQRFVRHEKSVLIGELFRRGRFTTGCRYFKRQVCGTTADLISEAGHGCIDKPLPMVGMRYPGGAIDEQYAILEIVRNTDALDWRLRWALLEIFQCGDERYLDDYASEYANLINQAGNGAATVSQMVSRAEFVVEGEIAPEERLRFVRSFREKLEAAHHCSFSKVLAHAPPLSPSHDANALVASATGDTPGSQKPRSEHEDNGFYLPGVFGRWSAMKEADDVLAIAEAQLRLGNLDDAKGHAVRVLQILQEGGWSIWGNLSANSTRAEALLREGSQNAGDVIRAYAPLLEAERHVPRWSLAEHLIAKVADLLRQDERSQLLQRVIEHIRLMVGEATNEIAMFDFFVAEPPCDASLEIFTLVLWLLDHPQWLRRDKAAGMVAWLVENEPAYLEQAAKEAFSMKMIYSAEILCGVLDGISVTRPRELWERVITLLDVEGVLRNCKHLARLPVLHRIAERAGNAGSITGTQIAVRVAAQFRPGAIGLGASEMGSDLPCWASCLSWEWGALDQLGVVTSELKKLLEEKLTEICAPLSVPDAWSLENAVSLSFRESVNQPLNRWEGRVRFALSSVLFPYASTRNFSEIESVLRVFNPSLPERTLTPGFPSPADAVLTAISTGNDYAGAIGDAECLFLNYHETTERGSDGHVVSVEVLAVIVPSSTVRRGFFLPSTDTSFRSKELPDLKSTTTSHETCSRLVPEIAFFGSFTPAFPLPGFIELIKARNGDFRRVNWRNGRSTDLRHCGRPVQEGCLLSIKRTAVSLPEEKKLAWIIRLNGETVTMVDSQNNQLI